MPTHQYDMNKEQFYTFLIDIYLNSKFGKRIVRPSPSTPRESRRYSLDGQEMIYTILMYNTEVPDDGWHCIASDYNLRQITSILEYLEEKSKDMKIEQYKFKMESVCGLTEEI